MGWHLDKQSNSSHLYVHDSLQTSYGDAYSVLVNTKTLTIKIYFFSQDSEAHIFLDTIAVESLILELDLSDPILACSLKIAEYYHKKLYL